MIRRPPGSTRTDTLFPYTTLFRSCRLAGEVAAAGLRCFDTPAATLAREWDPVRAYFEVLEAFDARYPGSNLKIGSNLAETHNRETRAVWRYARHRSEEHTYELPSLMRNKNTVFGLKKKKNTN